MANGRRTRGRPRTQPGAPLHEGNGHKNSSRSLHRVSVVRQRQGISLRTVARRMDLDLSEVRRQEREGSDITLSQLYNWQKILEVPVAELLVDLDQPLSPTVLRRAQLVRLMKTATTLEKKVKSSSVQRLVQMMIGQLVEIMPELDQVGPWQGNDEEANLDTREAG